MGALTTLLVIVTASASTYTPPRLEDGRPDLQGNWVAYNRTPLARPDWLTELYITEAQAREIEARGAARERDLSVPNETPEFFDERRVARIGGKLRSSIIIDPPDGRIPGTPLMREKIQAFRKQNNEDMDGPERRPLWERCLSSWASHPPMLAIGFTNLHQIVQTSDAVVFHSESLHDARILRLTGAHPPAAVDSFGGASIARWNGDTLEVETRNFKPDQNRAGDFLISSQTVVVERFTLTSHDELNYRFTISDPVHYTQPWTGETQYLRSNEPIFEDACHEGNYSLKHILEGGRVRDGTLR
ncbi:MAG TPA: hypothetical protein VFO35_22290 [Steroidobacteraceae bacterium]|nr:hypothetical protein [Steroidobacteraceae bacterium]